MKASELRTKSVDELKAELLELLKAQFGLRMLLATQQLDLALASPDLTPVQRKRLSKS